MALRGALQFLTVNTFLTLSFSATSGTFVLAAWTPELITATLTGIGGIITGIILLLERLKSVEKSVNGKMEETLKTAVAAAEARGVKQEQDQAKERSDAHAKGVLEAKLTPPLQPVVTDEK